MEFMILLLYEGKNSFFSSRLFTFFITFSQSVVKVFPSLLFSSKQPVTLQKQNANTSKIESMWEEKNYSAKIVFYYALNIFARNFFSCMRFFSRGRKFLFTFEVH